MIIDKGHKSGEKAITIGMSQLITFRKVTTSNNRNETIEKIAKIKYKGKIENQLFKAFFILEIEIGR